MQVFHSPTVRHVLDEGKSLESSAELSRRVHSFSRVLLAIGSVLVAVCQLVFKTLPLLLEGLRLALCTARKPRRQGHLAAA